ncbi:MAG: hypothetical protein VB081_07655 [Christensenella sp.]|uniref:hypothetical protein n=1 Tax=Christensenella sp. TaxID=1935934 RepID=UPI002B20B826|nr:hypothetical protein [Christensenella sp.]MEA5003359.1 hypothetical protein [Christensenella sp.]
MNKKICAILVVMLLMVSMAVGCAPVPVPTETVDMEAMASAVESLQAQSEEIADKMEDLELPEESQMPEYAPEPTPIPEYSAGEQNAIHTGYASEYLGLFWLAPQDEPYQLMTQDQMLEYAGLSPDNPAVQDYSITCEMMALTDGVNLDMRTQQIPISETSAQDYLDNFLETMELSGSISSIEVQQPRVLADIEFAQSSATSLSNNGSTLYHRYFTAKKYDRLITIHLSYDENSTDKAELALTYFQPYSVE